jgi:hypothetical protein
MNEAAVNSRLRFEGVPSVLHICPECRDLASGECSTCARAEAAHHALRAASLYGALPRVDAVDPRPTTLACPQWLLHLRGWVRVATVALFDCALLWLAIFAFWWAGKEALHELFY